METPSKQKWLWICLLIIVIGDGYAQDDNNLDDFYDYYDNLDETGGLPDDYKELYEYYNYYNEKDEEPTKTENSNGRSAPTDDVVEAAYEQGSHHNEERREWEGYGGEVDRRTEETDRHHYSNSYPNPSGTEKSENQPKSNDKDNEKDDAEWRRELIYKTYREQLDAYNTLVREEHAARFVTKTTATTTTTTTSARRTTQSPLDSDSDSEGTCRDSDSRCERWGLNGWCGLWKSITQVYCKKSCGFCDGRAPCADDKDVVSYCKSWKNNGDCESDYDYMFQRCPSTCGFCDEKGLKLAKRR